MEPLRRETLQKACRPAPILPPKGQTYAAVALIVTKDNTIWFIERAHRDGDLWSGHLAFPGGRHHEGDPSPVDTAKRETMEEIGLILDPLELVGSLSPVYPIARSYNLVVYPFVFFLDRPLVFRLDPSEVQNVVSVSLVELMNHRPRKIMRWSSARGNIFLPMIPIQPNTPNLWGLTLMIVDELLDRIDGRGRGFDRPSGE